MTLTLDHRLRERLADRVTAARLRCDLLRERCVRALHADHHALRRELIAAERERAAHEDVWNTLQGAHP